MEQLAIFGNRQGVFLIGQFLFVNRDTHEIIIWSTVDPFGALREVAVSLLLTYIDPEAEALHRNVVTNYRILAVGSILRDVNEAGALGACWQLTLYIYVGGKCRAVVGLNAYSDDVTVDSALYVGRRRADGDFRQVGLGDGNGLRASLLVEMQLGG